MAVNISMEWTDSGAVVKFLISIACPRCGTICSPGVEHRCGDQSEKSKKRRKSYAK